MTLRFLTEREHDLITRIADRLLPPRAGNPQDFPGAGACGAADYIDNTLGAFSFDPPRIWAGGPYSGRYGGEASFATFTELSRVETLAWLTRIEGSLGISEREWNGPVRGWQEIYRDGLAQVADDLTNLNDLDEFRDLIFEHACEATYGAPEYGGNHDLAGWNAIGYAGDVQPRGWSDLEVTGPGVVGAV